jgi:hypothetical protein
MMLRRFMSSVPKRVQLWAWVAVGCALLIGLVAGYEAADKGSVLRTMSAFGSAGLSFGMLAAIWLLCLGFVYADARRRAMRPVLWVLVAALFPHLLGFLLYFVLRQPLALPCGHCGHTVPLQQRFCSECGAAQAEPVAANGPLGGDSAIPPLSAG